jgi:hypothetical protein
MGDGSSILEAGTGMYYNSSDAGYSGGNRRICI